MAQTTHALLLAESNSIEYVPRLSPPTPRNPSRSSSIDSGSNYFPRGEPPEGANPTSLPSFYPSGSRDATPSSNPDKPARNLRDILFHGWRVVLVSCTPFLAFISPSDRITLKGSIFFWYWYHYPCVLLTVFLVDSQMNLGLWTSGRWRSPWKTRIASPSFVSTIQQCSICVY